LSEIPNLVPCLVLTELHMSPVNGIDFIAWIRSQSQLTRLPVVAISDWELSIDVEKALAAGANLCLTKFPSEEQLVTALQEVSGNAPVENRQVDPPEGA
jgi:CheY-like chemotaxis protein